MSRLGSRLLLGVAFLSLTFLATGCGAADKASTIPQETAVEAIRTRIEGAGVEVEWVSFRWNADFFGRSVRQATLSAGGPGSYVQFYRFRDAEHAAQAAGRVSHDGNSVPTGDGIASVSWSGPPHFFRRGRLIVLFTEGWQDGSAASGSRDRLVLQALREVMGRQFAGDSSSPE